MGIHVRRSPTRTWCAGAMTMTFLAAAGLGLLIPACAAKDDSAAIRQLVEKGASMAEDKRIGDLMDLADEGFVAMPGHHDAGTVRAILFSAFRQYGKFKIHYPRPAVEIISDTMAAATLYIVIVRQNQTIPDLRELYNDPRRWLERVGETADLYQLKLQLFKRDGRWRVQQAQLESFKGAGF